MKRVLPLLLVAACNQVYGLDPTQIVADAAPDAAPACSPELVYRPQFHQVIYQRCTSYSFARDVDRALAFCLPEDAPAFIGEGRVDSMLARVTVEGVASPVREPRISPEGDRMFLLRATAAGVTGFAVYHRDATAWRYAYDLPVIGDYDDAVGVPSARPNARFMHSRPNAGVVDEYVEEAPDTWRLWHSYPAADFDTISLYTQFNLTADGLHVIYQAFALDSTIVVRHAWRDDIGAQFRKTLPIMGVPRGTVDGVMTPDCGRLYFSGLSSIFYAQQR